MNEQEGRALGTAFRAMLDASAEPALPSVTDAAISGGRRIRRRRATASATGAMAAAVMAAAVVVAWPDRGTPVPLDPANSPMPVTPQSPPSVATPRPRPPTSTPAPASTPSWVPRPTPRSIPGEGFVSKRLP